MIEGRENKWDEPPQKSTWRTWADREHAFAAWANGASSRLWIVRSLALVSRIGDGWIWYGAVLFLPWAGGASGPSVAVRLFAVGLVDLVIVAIVKRWIARARPARGRSALVQCARALDEFSFPSGHTVHAVACSVILTAYYPFVGWLLWPFVLLIATSRIVLGLHYPSDVIVGAAIGAATALVSFNLL